MAPLTVRGSTAYRSAVLACCATLLASSGAAQGGRWIATWGASPQAANHFGPIAPVQDMDDQTIRQVVRVSAGGGLLRIRLSNEFGSQPLAIGAVTVARAGDGASVVPGSIRAVTFGGSSSIVIPPGAPAVSDPVRLRIRPRSDVAISIHLPRHTAPTTMHVVGLATTYISPPGDHTGAVDMPVATTTTARLFLSGVSVRTRTTRARVIVAIGDSITDGAGSTVDANQRWPDHLERRLRARGGRPWAVVDAGISSNQLLRDGAGVSGLARFDRDVLAVPGVTHVVLLQGVNDIGFAGVAANGIFIVRPEDGPTADDLIAGYRQAIARAHARGLKIVGATLTPFAGFALEGYYGPTKEALRQEVNRWIRTTFEYDAVVDFDAAIRDPADPTRMRSEYDSGDHLHPGDAGYRAMARAFDLSVFR